ncbi:hypothetical protein ACFFIS_09990 [Virgibacillus soli]|uniref:hypothetical protein n=1 Tax=Paracerasibacillus soli TaxID=480284 RepID=UPI0035EF614B
MNDKINIVVEYIDEHYRDDINCEKIEGLTAGSIKTFEEVFQEKSGIRFKDYKLRRQLTLIKEEIMKLNLSLDDADVTPFENQLIYSFYFQREFAISLEAAIEHKYLSLQPKYKSPEWEKNDSVIFKLLKKYKPNDALRFLLSLPPCYLNASDQLGFYAKGVPRLGYERSYPIFPDLDDPISRLKNLYTLENDILIKDSKNRSIRYAIVNRHLIYKLILEHEAKIEYSLSELKTILSFLPYRNVNFQFNKERPVVKESILNALHNHNFDEDQCESLLDLLVRIGVDYSKPINERKEGQEGLSN